MRRIVVGFDGSAEAWKALRWAAQEADRRSAELLVARAWHERILDHRSWYEMWQDPDGARKAVDAELAQVADRLAAERPGRPVAHVLLGGDPAAAIVELGEDADLVVVGARGRGGFTGLLLGSVGRRVAASATSPVVIVRDGGRPDGDVVVGVDGLRAGRGALRWAADEAGRRGVRLRVVMAWTYLLPESADGPEPFLAEYTVSTARIALRQIVGDVLGAEPGIEVALEVPCEGAANALIERSSDACLLVVGPRRASLQHRVDVGSVTAQVLEHARVPVAVVREPVET